jgi:methionine-rich copper-binding protein CopC
VNVGIIQQMKHPRPNHLFRVAGLALLALVAGVWLAVPTSAQEAGEQAPARTDSEPPDGAFLHEPPDDVTVTFSEPLDPSSSLAVFDECGRQIDAGDSTATGTDLHVSIAEQPAGVYVARYTATGIGGITGTTEGEISFEVHFGPACDGDEQEDGGGHGGKKGAGAGHHGGGKAGEDHAPADHGASHTPHPTGVTTAHTASHETNAATGGHRHRPERPGRHHKGRHRAHEDHKQEATPNRPRDGGTRERAIATETALSPSADASALALALGGAIALGAVGGLYLRKLQPGN